MWINISIPAKALHIFQKQVCQTDKLLEGNTFESDISDKIKRQTQAIPELNELIILYENEIHIGNIIVFIVKVFFFFINCFEFKCHLIH